MTPLAFVEEEARSGCVFAYSCLAVPPASFGQCPVGIGYHDLFAEGIDEVLRPSRDHDTMGVERGEADRIA